MAILPLNNSANKNLHMYSNENLLYLSKDAIMIAMQYNP